MAGLVPGGQNLSLSHLLPQSLFIIPFHFLFFPLLHMSQVNSAQFKRSLLA